MKTATLLFMMTTALAAGSGPGFNLPAPQTFKLRNGMTVFYLRAGVGRVHASNERAKHTVAIERLRPHL